MSEESFHKAVVQLLTFTLPDDVFFFHPPNGEYRKKATAARLKAMGTKAGMPDICLIRDGKLYGIELKYSGRLVGNRMEGRGYLSKTQRDCHALLRDAGATVTTCWDLDDVERTLRNWGFTKKRGGLFQDKQPAEARA